MPGADPGEGDVALGEQLIHDVYEALHAGPGWPGTLLVVTYDEHGGCYDHVPPLIAPGTVYRVPARGRLDYTSVLKTVEQCWNLSALTARDAAAPGFGDVFRPSAPRTDDVLTGIAVPVASGTSRAATTIWHLEAVRAELISRRFPAGVADNPKPAWLGCATFM